MPATLESRSPATGERLGAVEAASAAAVRDAAGWAEAAQRIWAAVPPAARARYVRRAARIVLDDLDELALLLARETGRPRTEAVLGELLPTVTGLSALADDGPAALADRRLGRPSLLRGGRRAVGVQQPRGVVGILGGAASPWTEPALEVAAALLAGNGVVLAPAAPLVGERLRGIFVRAGVPGELLFVAHGPEAAAALPSACARIVSVAAPPAKGTMLVLAGAPVEHVASAALWAAFAAGGRHPAAVSRLVCVPSVADGLIATLGDRAHRLHVGDPTSPDAEVGPLASHADLGTIEELVEEAVAAGAERVCGGPTTVPGLSGAFYAPAVLRRVPAGARILHEPAPGPVLAVVEAASEADAIAFVSGPGAAPPAGGRGMAAGVEPAAGAAVGTGAAAGAEGTEAAGAPVAAVGTGAAAGAEGTEAAGAPVAAVGTGAAAGAEGTEAAGAPVAAAATGTPAGAVARDRRARGTIVSVWAGDRPKGERVSRTLTAELAWVNEHGVVAPGPALRLARHVAPRQVASRPAPLAGARRLPYDPALVRARTAAARFAHGREQDRFTVVRRDAIPLARAMVRVARELVRR
jgi:acyl-CoA reductase-like NAD-dependent aldehyde dehydrogenase